MLDLAAPAVRRRLAPAPRLPVALSTVLLLLLALLPSTGCGGGGGSTTSVEPVPSLAGPWLLVHEIVESAACAPLIGSVVVARAEILQDNARVRLFVIGGLLELRWANGELGGSGALTDGGATFFVEEARFSVDAAGELAGTARWRLEANGVPVCTGSSVLSAARLPSGTLAEIDGGWRIAQEVTRVENGCTGSFLPTSTHDARLSRSGDDLQLDLGNGLLLSGRADGSGVQWTSSRAATGSLSVQRVDLLISRTACLGEADWTWTTALGSCSGTSTIAGFRTGSAAGMAAGSLLLVREDRSLAALAAGGTTLRLEGATGDTVTAALSPGNMRLLRLRPGTYACVLGDGGAAPQRLLDCVAGDVHVVTTSDLADARVTAPF